ncbi:hypothetical protein CHARACLAT_030246, partial [Characodon lateralis]|nr:hypothetical protein [Characodon lateralis]
GFWNPPLAPRKNYNIYLQAVSSTERETKTQCLRLAAKRKSTLSLFRYLVETNTLNSL